MTERDDQHRARHHDQRADQTRPDIALGEVAMANRLYQATREPVFLTAARNWFEWVSFLNGSTGVALALLASAGTSAPASDRLLLSDVSVRTTGNHDGE